MPHKFNESRRHHIPPTKYKVTNWPEYNKASEQRGNVTLWFNHHTVRNWYAKSNGQKRYSNSTIEAAALLRLVFYLPYRQTFGFISSILKLMALELSVPNFSTLSRRIKKLGVRLSKPSEHKAGTHIIIDGSGLAVQGAKFWSITFLFISFVNG